MSGLDRAALRIALTELLAYQADAAATQMQGEGWRRALVASRRQLQQQFSRLSELLHAAGDGDDARILMPAFNRMRSEVALHQASWPAVAIDVAEPGYSASLQRVLRANREFAELAGRLLASG